MVVHSKTSPSGVGMKPGTTSPCPFSIQTPTKHRAHARFSVTGARRVRCTDSSTMATVFIASDAQIQARKASSPKNR